MKVFRMVSYKDIISPRVMIEEKGGEVINNDAYYEHSARAWK